VVIRYADRALELDVVDDSGRRTATVNGSGHGLIGMRERVALYDGTLEAGPRAGGGYAVRARLPLGDTP
jgi:signal transduction histidine kinase